ncbi:Alcohol dehydrogenase-like 6, partial [Linum perenne]
MTEERQIHLDCKNASNPYHECVEYCFKRIAESKVRAAKEVGLEEMPEEDVTKLIGRRKKLYEFKRKMYEENKANQMEIVVENKRLEPPLESRGVSKQNRLKERKKKMSKLLDANDLDMKTKYMLDTQEGDIGEIQEMGKRSLLLPAEMFSTRRVYKMPTKSKLKMSDRFGDDDTFSSCFIARERTTQKHNISDQHPLPPPEEALHNLHKGLKVDTHDLDNISGTFPFPFQIKRDPLVAGTANCGSEVITTTKLSVIESVFKLREAQPSAIVEEMRKSLVDLRLIMVYLSLYLRLKYRLPAIASSSSFGSPALTSDPDYGSQLYPSSPPPSSQFRSVPLSDSHSLIYPVSGNISTDIRPRSIKVSSLPIRSIFESIGDGVTEFKEGVHVLTVFTVECRTCKHCTSGKSNLCQVIKRIIDGGADYSFECIGDTGM